MILYGVKWQNHSIQSWVKKKKTVKGKKNLSNNKNVANTLLREV